jgi:hypothetical protein
VTATGLDPEAVWNEPIVRCLKKIGCVIALVSDVSLDPAQAGLALQNSPADSDRSLDRSQQQSAALITLHAHCRPIAGPCRLLGGECGEHLGKNKIPSFAINTIN